MIRSFSPICVAAALSGCSLVYVDEPCDTAPPSEQGDWVAVASGTAHACAQNERGEITCTADSSSAELADAVTAVPDGAFAQVVAGYNFSCALDTDGRVSCWGLDLATTALDAPPDATFAQIDAGNQHVCGVTVGGTVQCWGRSEDDRTAGTTDIAVSAVSAGFYHGCAVRAVSDTETSVGCWGTPPGSDDHGQASPPETLTDATQISVSTTRSCALNAAGTPTCWGEAFSDWALEGNFASLDLGDQGACGLSMDGEAICAGRLAVGMPEGLVQISVSLTQASACGVDGAGLVQCWGEATYAFDP